MNERAYVRQVPGDTRQPNRWGFTSFPTEDDARAYLRQFTTSKGQPWHIWRLPDGSFDFTSTPSPRQNSAIEGDIELAGTQLPD